MPGQSARSRHEVRSGAQGWTSALRAVVPGGPSKSKVCLMETVKTQKRQAPVSRWVFWPGATIVLVFATFAITLPDVAETLFASIENTIVTNLNWYYVLIASFFVVFCMWMGFGRFGSIKLGKDDDEPEFSLQSWFALLFAAGMGIGLVFYGVSEPLSHFAQPAPGVTGTAPELAQAAMTQTFLHWGVHAWSIYVVIGLALAYAIHRRGRPISIRWALEPLLGKSVRGAWGNTIDVIALVGTMFGVATSLGLGVLQISAGLESAGIMDATMAGNIMLIIVITGAVLFSVVSGLGKGMKWLSNGNLLLAGTVILLVLILGPTQFLLRNFVESIGAYLQNFVGMAFNVSAFEGDAGESWQAGWTTFYWGWWISWAPFVGIFIARISRGRTVRQFVSGVILVPTLLTFLWFSVLGGSAVYAVLNGNSDLISPTGTVNVEGALFTLLDSLPGGTVLTFGALILIAVFFVTSADSGSLVMGMIASGGQSDPKVWIRVFFACASSLLAIALLISGGLEALKTAAIIIAVPFSVIMLAICWATAIAFTRELRVYDRARRATFRAHIGDYYGLEVEQPLEKSVSETLRSKLPRWGRMGAGSDSRLRRRAQPKDSPPDSDN